MGLLSFKKINGEVFLLPQKVMMDTKKNNCIIANVMIFVKLIH